MLTFPNTNFIEYLARYILNMLFCFFPKKVIILELTSP